MTPAVFLLALLTICVATVPLAGGRLGGMADIRFTRAWAGIGAITLQYTILKAFPHGDRGLHAALHLASYGLIFYFIAGNLRIPGLPLIALGGILNALAIVANHGVMPARPEALHTAGILQAPGEFANSAAVAHPKLWFLGDVFALPAGFPMANVFSVGDLVLVLGCFVLLHRQSASRLGPLFDRAAAWVSARVSARQSLLRDNRPFRNVWIAQAISCIGDWVFIPAVYAAVVRGHAGTSDLALLLIAQVVPGMIVGLFGGPFVDRFSRKWLMVATDVIRALAVGSLLFGGRPSLEHVYAVSFVLGIGGALFQPAFLAALPNLVRRRELASANAFVGLTQSVAIMVGFPIGGFIVDTFGTQWGFGVNALSFGFSGVLVLRTAMRTNRKVATESLITELGDGFRYVRRSPVVRGVIIVVSLITVGAGIKSPLEPLFALHSLDAGSAGFGLLGAFWGGGMIAGSFVASRMDRRLGHGRMLTYSAALVGGAVLLASASPVLAPVALLWVFGGIANTTGTVAYETLLQERTDDAILGRVMAALEASLQAGLLVGVGIAAASDHIFGGDPARSGIALSGMIFCLAGLASWLLLDRRRSAAPERLFEVRGVEVVPTGAFALLRVTATSSATEAAPVLLVDDGSRVHRLEPLPGGAHAHNGHRRYGYGVPSDRLARRRAALALEGPEGNVMDLPRVAVGA